MAKVDTEGKMVKITEDNLVRVVDPEGKTIKIIDDNMVRVDGIGVFRRVQRDGVIFVEFVDTDKYRSGCRGSRFVQIPLHILIEKLNPKEKPNGLNAGKPTQP